MVAGPGDSAEDRGLVFVSYSHADVGWVQRFDVMLRPLLRRRGLRLWVDSAIRASEEWDPAIAAAIARSRAALLLVSADFLASEYITERELPELVQHGVPLAPVLVGDCYWQELPELARVQWLHDPAAADALGLDADHPARRDRRIREACDRLVEILPAVMSPGHVVESVSPRPSAVELPSAGRAGAKSGVPPLPPGYVVRDELDPLVDAVTATEFGGAVGLVAGSGPVGLHGQGGIGKTVLATALAHDDRIGPRFPDGIFWVTVGEKPDLLALQLDLLNRLDAATRTPRSVPEATEMLRDVLATRRALLVVDDVWSDAAAHAFRVSGPKGRVLYTTRDAGVVTHVGALALPVAVLPADGARALAAAVLEVPVEILPADADDAFAAVGRVALAVALLAAAVRGGRSWSEVARTLARDVDVYGDHPYANTFKAMQIAVAALPKDLARALVSLAVFPPDTGVPVVAVARYWGHTRGTAAEETAADLDRLTEAGVLRRDGDHIGFHDLQHDYLLLHAPALPLLHAGLLDAYRRLLPDGEPDEWWRLPPDEPYIGDHLVAHLVGSGERRALGATVTDPAYLCSRIAVAGVHAAEGDLARAAAALPDHPVVGWWRAWLPRHAHHLDVPEYRRTTDETAGVALSSTLLAWLQVARGRPVAVDATRLRVQLPMVHPRPRWGLEPPRSALARVLIGHTGSVDAVAWLADGVRLVSAAADGTVRLWNRNTGDNIVLLDGLRDEVPVLACRPRSPEVAIGRAETLLLHDPDGSAGRTVVTRHRGGIRALAWRTDGERLASSGGDGTIRVYDMDGVECSVVVTDHVDGTQEICWSPTGDRIASTGADGKLRVWDASSGERIVLPTDHTRQNRAVAWSPDGRVLATGGTDGAVRLWDASSGANTAVRSGHANRVWAIAWSPDGARLASIGSDAVVRLWAAETAERVDDFTGHSGAVRSIDWSADGAHLASGGDDGKIRLWRPGVTDRSAKRNTPSGADVWMLCSPDGRHLAVPEQTGDAVRVLEMSRGEQVALLADPEGGEQSFAWSPDGSRLCVIDRAGSAIRQCIPDAGSAAVEVYELSSHGLGSWWRPNHRRLAWAPDGRWVVVFDDSGYPAVIWDPVRGRAVRDLRDVESGSGVRAVAWLPNDRRLAVLPRRRLAVGLLDVNSGAVEDWDQGWHVQEVSLSPLGDRLAVVRTGTFELWDPSTMTLRAMLDRSDDPEHDFYGVSIGWSPDGRHLVVAQGVTRDVRLFDSSTGKMVAVLGRLPKQLDSITWSPDGRRLAILVDHEVWLWDPASGSPTAGLVDRDGVRSVAWSPDGHQLVTATGDSVVVLWSNTGERLASVHLEPIAGLSWAPADSFVVQGTDGHVAAFDIAGGAFDAVKPRF